MISKFKNWLVAAMLLGVMVPGSARADIMDVDVSGVDPLYRSFFLDAEAFWESRIIGYSKSLPRIVQSQLTKLQIGASTADIDGVGGVLGQAGPIDVLRYAGGRNTRPIAIARTAQMQFDNADMADMLATGDLLEVIKHEMAHALGFGSLWADNALLTADRFGAANYTGSFALKKYREESGRTFASFVPVEQGGGAGTAGAHWDDDDSFFNRRATSRSSDLMIGSIDLGNENKFTSETTWASFADLHFVVKGINDGDFNDAIGGGRRTWPKWTGPDRPLFMRAVPEPTSAGVLTLSLLAGLGLCRRRKSV